MSKQTLTASGLFFLPRIGAIRSTAFIVYHQDHLRLRLYRKFIFTQEKSQRRGVRRQVGEEVGVDSVVEIMRVGSFMVTFYLLEILLNLSHIFFVFLGTEGLAQLTAGFLLSHQCVNRACSTRAVSSSSGRVRSTSSLEPSVLLILRSFTYSRACFHQSCRSAFSITASKDLWCSSTFGLECGTTYVLFIRPQVCNRNAYSVDSTGTFTYYIAVPNLVKCVAWQRCMTQPGSSARFVSRTSHISFHTHIYCVYLLVY